MENEKINLVVVEDDKEIKQLMVSYFEKDEDNFKSVVSFGSVEELLAGKVNHDDTIILLDIGLPGISGVDGIFHIKQHCPQAEIIMISVLSDSNNIFKSICAGASGYLDKDTPLHKIKEAIIDLSQGGSPITPAIARKVFDFFKPNAKLTEELTKREKDVVQGLVEGLSYKLIASKLEVSIDTVRKYVRRIYKKMQINSKGELLAMYRQVPESQNR